MGLNSKIIVQEAAHGKGLGLFATEPIAQGEVIWTSNEDEASHFLTLAQIRALPVSEAWHYLRVAYLVEPGVYSGVSLQNSTAGQTDHGERMNHSCDGERWDQQHHGAAHLPGSCLA